MSNKRLTPDGQGGFRSLPTGERLVPDGRGGFHVLPDGGAPNGLIDLFLGPVMLLAIPGILLLGTCFVFEWIVSVPAALIFGQAFLDANGGLLGGIAVFLTIVFWVVVIARRAMKKK